MAQVRPVAALVVVDLEEQAPAKLVEPTPGIVAVENAVEPAYRDRTES
jgi:hypothetical protein